MTIAEVHKAETDQGEDEGDGSRQKWQRSLQKHYPWESMFIANEPEEDLMNTGEPLIRSRLFNYSRKTN
jgi:hypothetical protein